MSNQYSQKLVSLRALSIAVLITLLSLVQTFGQTLAIIPTTAPGLAPRDYMPLGTLWGFQRTQMQYADAELSTAGLTAVPTGGHYIVSVAFFCSNAAGVAATTPITIRMRQTGVVGLVSTVYPVASSGTTQVFSGTVNSSGWTTGSWITIPLTTPFYYTFTGINNLEVLVETNFGGSGFEVTPTEWARTNIPGANRCQTWTADGQPSNGNGFVTQDRPDIRLGFWKETACNAAPGLGALTTVSSNTSVCSAPAQQFTLSVTGIPFTPPATVPGGYTYQWQTSAAAGGPWANLGLATTNTTLVTTQAVATFYHCIVTCVASGSTSTSSALQVGIVQCYCIPSTNFTNDTDIGQVVFGSLTNPAFPGSTTNNPLASNSYTDYTSVLPQNYMQGVNYGFTVSQITSGGTFWSAVAHVWIDFDKNGTFDPSEHYYMPGPTGPTGTAPSTTSLSVAGGITIPFTAVPGITRMRVVLRETCCGSAGGPTNLPCDTYNWGEIEDYNVNIIAGAPCNVTAVGIATTTFTSICAGQPFTLGVSGNTGYGSGMTFVWQQSNATNGFVYTDIFGANTYPFTTTLTENTCYRLKLTCSANFGGAAQYTSNICVALIPVSLCACPVSHLNCPSSPWITTVDFNTLNNVTACSSGNGPGWTVYAPVGTNTTTLTQGASYPFTITTGGSGAAIISVWIDYTQNGFDVTDHTQVALNLAAGVPITISIPIPLGAVPGQTNMRVRTRAAGNPNGPGDYCLPMFSGEAEDYTVTIAAAAPTPCDAFNFVGRNITTSQNLALPVCSGTQINFSLSPSLTVPTVYSGITYQWKTSPTGLGGSFVAAPGVNTNGSYSGTFTQTTWLQCIIACGNSGTFYTTANVKITIIPSTWLGFTTDWSDGANWCGRIPTIVDPTQINKPVALAFPSRGAAPYFFPVASIRDTVLALSLDISSSDSMTVITDTLLKVNIANDLSNSGKFAILSAQAADTATIKTAVPITSATNFGQIFRGNQNDQIYQVIYNPSELTGIGMIAGNIVDSLLFQFKNRASSSVGFQGFKISYAQVPIATLSSFASSAPFAGPFTLLYSQNLNTAAPINGQWTPYTSPITRAFTGNITNAGTTITFVAPNPLTSGLSIGDFLSGYAGIQAGAVVTGMTSTTITMDLPATSTSPANQPFSAKNSGGWLRLATNVNPFVWNGVDNIVLQICFDNGATSATAIDEMFVSSTTPTKTALFLSNANSSGQAVGNAGCSLTLASTGLTNSFGLSPSVNRPNITFRFRNVLRRLTATIGGQVLNNASGKMWVSSADMMVATNLVNAGTFNFQDSSYTQIGGDMTNSGSLVGSNIAMALKPAIQFNGTNWTNNGIMTPGNSRVTFGTATSQTIGGTNASSFYDFNMQKTSNADVITMNKGIIIGDSLALRLGQIRMNKNPIAVNNSNVNGIARIITGSATASTTVPLAIAAAATSVTVPSVAGIAIGDLIENPSMSIAPQAHVVGVNSSTLVVTFFPPTTGTAGAGSTIKFYKAGYLIGEDSLSKVNWLIDAVTGNRTVPFANITTNGAANPLHIPINFSLAATNAVDMDTVSFATYKALTNSPFPPTVSHLNSAGPVRLNTTGTTGIGLTLISAVASTAGMAIGDQVTGPGIPLGAVVTAFTVNSITISVPATATGVGVTITSGAGIAAGSNNDLYTAERFWILGKSSAPVVSIQANTTSGSAVIPVSNTAGILVGQTVFGTGLSGTVSSIIVNTSITLSAAATATVTGNNIAFNFPLTAITFTFAYDERPCSSGISPYLCATLSNKLAAQPWYNQTIPTVQQSWKRLVFTGSPYTITQYLVTTLTGMNYNTVVANYPWLYGNYTPWAVTVQNNPLPVELISFNANLKGEDVLLDWSTASEKNNDFFTVERTLDFEEMTDVAKVRSYGDGSSTSLQNYSTWDFEPVKGAINYYRLRQTDKDGTTTIASEYVPVRIGLNSIFDIKYVSVSSENSIDVIFDYDSNQPVNYVLYDLTGRMVANGTRSDVDKGIYMLKMDGSKLAHGMYMITLRNKDKVVSKKFVY